MPKTGARKRMAISLETKKALCLYKRGDHPDCSHTVDNDESDEEPTPPMSAQQGRRYISIL